MPKGAIFVPKRQSVSVFLFGGSEVDLKEFDWKDA